MHLDFQLVLANAEGLACSGMGYASSVYGQSNPAPNFRDLAANHGQAEDSVLDRCHESLVDC